MHGNGCYSSCTSSPPHTHYISVFGNMRSARWYQHAALHSFDFYTLQPHVSQCDTKGLNETQGATTKSRV